MARNSDLTFWNDRSSLQPSGYRSPFWTLERMADEIDRMFDDMGMGRGLMRPSAGRQQQSPSRGGEWGWAPQIDVSHRNNELVICADLPGMNKDDVKVDVTEDRVTIQGERKREHEETKEGVYRSERSYGSFYREIPLPPGTMADQAKASFKNGVLEVRMPSAPESARRGRQLEIKDESMK